MTAEAKKQDFLAWLNEKSPNDYWHYPNAPKAFALHMQARFKQQQAENNLACEHVVWHITNRCNLRCEHCGVWGGEKIYPDISVSDFLKRMPVLQTLGLKAMTLSGGEPFLVPEIFDMIAYCRRHQIKIAAVTNGHFMQRDASQLEQTPVDSLSISIDGLADTHNQLRRSHQSYAKALEAIAIAAAIPIPIVNINTSVFPDNLNELPALREAIFEKGARHWVLRPVALSGRAKGKPLKLSNAQIIELLHFADASVRAGYDVTVEGLGYLGRLDSVLSLTPYVSYTGWNGFYVLPNGDIKGFNDDIHPVEGNLLSSDLKSLWLTGFQDYRFPELTAMCSGCEFWESCGGGNIAEAENGGWRCIQEVLPLL